MISIHQFSRFCKEKIRLRERVEKLTDNRVRPQIKAGQIGWTMLYMPALRFKSLLQVDQRARRGAFKQLVGSSRKLVGSDTTFQRVLKQMALKPIRALGKALYRQIVNRGINKVESCKGKRVRVGIVDGSGFGHYFASVVMIAGKRNYPLDAEVYEKHGKELIASRKLLGRVTKQLGKGWCDITLADGLYMTKEDFRRSKEEYGCDLLVKTKEKTLEVVADAKGLLFSSGYGVEVSKGTDTLRNVVYEIRALGGFEWEGLSYPLKVAWIREEKLKPKKGEEPVEEFFVITTREDLSCKEMRELAHTRWRIENEVFKRLNSLVKSKRVYTHSSHTLSVLLLLWLIGLTLLEMFLDGIDASEYRRLFGKVRLTFGLILDELQFSLREPVLNALSP